MKAILSAHDDNFSRIPRKIKVNLLEIEKIIVDDAIRSRNPQWRHYSKTTELLVCEGDLRNICDRETLNKCEQIIKRAERRKMDEARRKKEDKKERERERKLEKERLEKEMAFSRETFYTVCQCLGKGTQNLTKKKMKIISLRLLKISISSSSSSSSKTLLLWQNLIRLAFTTCLRRARCIFDFCVSFAWWSVVTADVVKTFELGTTRAYASHRYRRCAFEKQRGFNDG